MVCLQIKFCRVLTILWSTTCYREVGMAGPLADTLGSCLLYFLTHHDHARILHMTKKLRTFSPLISKLHFYITISWCLMLGVLINKLQKKSFQIVKNHLCFTSRQIIVIDQIHNRKIKNIKMTNHLHYVQWLEESNKIYVQMVQRFNEMGSLPVCNEDALPINLCKNLLQVITFLQIIFVWFSYVIKPDLATNNLFILSVFMDFTHDM
jgi:hypothetical protein